MIGTLEPSQAQHLMVRCFLYVSLASFVHHLTIRGAGGVGYSGKKKIKGTT